MPARAAWRWRSARWGRAASTSPPAWASRFNNNLPLLAITTNQHRAAAYPHSGMFMDLDTRAVFAPLTKWNAVVHDPRRMPELVRRAFREALSGRPGPVHLDIPQDVLAAVARIRRRRVRSGAGALSRHARAAAVRARRSSAAARVAAAAQAAAGRGRWRRRHERRRGRRARHRTPARRAGGADADGARRGRQRQPAFHRPRRPDHRGDAVRAAFDGGRRGAQPSAAASRRGCGTSAARSRAAITAPSTSTSTRPRSGIRRSHEVAMQADAGLALEDLLAALDVEPANSAPMPAGSPACARCAPATRPGSRRWRANRPEVMHPAALAKAIADALPADALAVYRRRPHHLLEQRLHARAARCARACTNRA